ncbi:FAD binding domain-containing protein [Ephemerocybe angulata]|uniref:FAD binding domain-containing protein n=1 Tax=Ephemerocybe angulata TaxID=980116 RepID=A0A8H6HB36_9AGAR|nr:FAD binding domain-containing protein [Tulosesus angulatus]
MTSSFTNIIKGDVITVDHPEYISSLARWAKNAERKARVVVFVKDADDVSRSIIYAKENNLQIAIRGGGHNAAGASSAEDGLVIDLSRYLQGVRVDAKEKLAYVGGGALWKHVDAEAIKYGLATVGGKVNHLPPVKTGVGGLTVGGGHGYLSDRHGLTIDNLKRVTIVTASGATLTANESENEDLFWAVRGGGSNFGVVTEFVFQLHPQRATVFAGAILFPVQKAKELVEATTKWLENIKADESMTQVYAVDDSGKLLIAAFVFFNGSEEEGRMKFKSLYDIGPAVDLAKEIPYEELNGLMGTELDHGKSYYLSGLSQKKPCYEATVELIQIGFEYMSQAKVNSVPVSATAFRRQLAYNILCNIQWDGEGPDRTDEARLLAREMTEIILRGQGTLSEAEKQGYTNYGHGKPHQA